MSEASVVETINLSDSFLMEGRDMLRGVIALILVLLASPALGAGDGVSAFYAGHKALEEGDTEAAIAAFTEALNSKTLDQTQIAYVYHYRAVAFQKLDKQKEAIDDYSQALAIGSLPKRVQAAVYYNRAIGLDRQQDYASAVRDYTSAIALKPDYAEAYMNRGNAHRKLGDKAQALKDYEASSQYGNPMKHLPYFGRGLVLEEMGDTERAYDAFKIAASLAPPDFIYAAQKVADYDAGRIPMTSVADAGRADASEGITAAIQPREETPAPESRSPPADEPAAVDEAPGADALTEAPLREEAKAEAAENNEVPEAAAEPAPALEAAAAPEALAPAPVDETNHKPAPVAEAPVREAPVKVAVTEAPALNAAPKPDTPKAAPPATQIASIAPVGFLVQVASYTSEAAALTEAAQMKRRNADIFGDVGDHIIKADLGAKGTYWRLQFGPFTSQEESAGFCKKLKSRGLDCIVVKNKS